MITVPGSTSKTIAKNLSKLTGIPIASISSKRFPDGELYLRIHDSLDNQHVLLIQNSYPDDAIVELFLLQDAILESGVKKFTTIVPYFGYARQDKKFMPGEPISARAILKRLDCDELITFDIHNEKVLQYFKGQAKNLSAMPSLGGYLKKFEPGIVIAPDVGAVERAKAVAQTLGSRWDYLEKERISSKKVEIKTKKLDVKGEKVALVDDIIATGGTIIEASKWLKRQGAKKVYAACTHGLFVGNALERLSGYCDKVISTDTIETKTSVVSVAHEIAKFLGLK